MDLAVRSRDGNFYGGYENFDTDGNATVLYFVGTDYNENVYLAQNDADRITVSGDNISRIFFVSDGSTTVNNLTLTNGKAPSVKYYSSDPDNGGAIYNNEFLELSNVVITGSSAEYGGGIYNDTDGTIYMDKVKFSLNSANTNGGGIYN